MSKIKTTNKRAFTLTELLIVVIVIGVLSAVTLPKFNRVIENRKVTEAEEMMSAVRTEQERRCTLDQNYTTNFDSLSDVIASANTKNYTYSLQSQGISAKSNSGDYTLKILSYEDGSYCCTGAGCKKLNKNYPDCATLSFPTSNCAGTEGGITPPGGEPTPVEPVEPEEPECVDGQVTGNQACNGCGTRTTKKCVGGKWVNSLGACSKTAEECAPKPECSGTQPADAIKQCECGTVKASYKCDASTNYQWVQGEFPECPAKPADITETCPCGETRSRSFSCNNGTWEASAWDIECKPEEECACTPSEKYLGSVRITQAEANAADTCDGNGFDYFTCDSSMKGKSCIDYYKQYPVSQAKGTAEWVDYRTENSFTPGASFPYHYTVIRNGDWPTKEFSYNNSTCTASIVDKLWSGGSVPNARDMCALQCHTRDTMTLCDSSCRVVTNCNWWKDGARPSGWNDYSITLGSSRCVEWRLKCTKAVGESIWSVGKREMTCC